MRRSRKPVWAVSSIEGSNPSLSAPSHSAAREARSWSTRSSASWGSRRRRPTPRRRLRARPASGDREPEGKAHIGGIPPAKKSSACAAGAPVSSTLSARVESKPCRPICWYSASTQRGTEFATVLDPEFLHRPVQVGFDGPYRQHEAVGDLHVGQALRRQLHQLTLPVREAESVGFETADRGCGSALTVAVQFPGARGRAPRGVLPAGLGEDLRGGRSALRGVGERADGFELVGTGRARPPGSCEARAAASSA